MNQGQVIRLHPSAVTVDAGIQQRAGGVEEAWAGELAEVLKGGGVYRDNPVAFEDPDPAAGGKIYLAGGFHRHRGAEIADLPIDYMVIVGTRRDALRYALGDNAGMPRTADDKRKAVLTALADPEWSQLSDRKLADLCCVSAHLVGEIRRGLGRAKDETRSANAVLANQAKVERKEAKAKADANPRPSPAADPTPSGEGVLPPPPAAPTTPGSKSAKGEDKPQSVPRDRLGRPLPWNLKKVFADGEKIRAAVRGVRAARTHAAAADGLDTVGGFLKRNAGIGAALRSAEDGLLRALPWAVCNGCNGDGKGSDGAGCPSCGGKGWVTHPEYKALHPDVQEDMKRYAPGDSWEGDDPEPEPPAGEEPAFVPQGPGRDPFGTVIPPSLRDVVADEYLPQVAADLRSMAAGLKSATAWNPHLDPVVPDALTAAADKVAGARFYAVHRRCGAEGCEACATAGWFPAWMRHELEADRKPKRQRA